MTVRRLLAVVAWTLVVLVCSGVVWGVIRTAGTGVTSASSLPGSTGTAIPADRATPATPTTPPRPHRHRHPHRTGPTQAPSASPTPTVAPSARPSPPSATGGPRTGTSGHDHPAPPSGTQQQPTEVRRTWQGKAGAVVAGCRGSTITLHGAQPNSGWRIEVGDRGPEEVEVHFATEQDDGGEVEVHARCVGGEPRFSASSSASDD